MSNGNIYVSGSLNIDDIMLIDGKNSDSGELFCSGGWTCKIGAYKWI